MKLAVPLRDPQESSELKRTKAALAKKDEDTKKMLADKDESHKAALEKKDDEHQAETKRLLKAKDEENQEMRAELARLRAQVAAPAEGVPDV